LADWIRVELGWDFDHALQEFEVGHGDPLSFVELLDEFLLLGHLDKEYDVFVDKLAIEFMIAIPDFKSNGLPVLLLIIRLQLEI